MCLSWPAMLGTTRAHAHEARLVTGASPLMLAKQTELALNSIQTTPYKFPFMCVEVQLSANCALTVLQG